MVVSDTKHALISILYKQDLNKNYAVSIASAPKNSVIRKINGGKTNHWICNLLYYVSRLRPRLLNRRTRHHDRFAGLFLPVES